MSDGGIAGIVIACIIFIVLIGFAYYWFVIKKKQDKDFLISE